MLTCFFTLSKYSGKVPQYSNNTHTHTQTSTLTQVLTLKFTVGISVPTQLLVPTM